MLGFPHLDITREAVIKRGKTRGKPQVPLHRSKARKSSSTESIGEPVIELEPGQLRAVIERSLSTGRPLWEDEELRALVRDAAPTKGRAPHQPRSKSSPPQPAKAVPDHALRAPRAELGELVGFGTRPLDELARALESLDLMQMPDEVAEWDIGQLLSSVPLYSDETLDALKKIVLEFSTEPAAQEPPSPAAWRKRPARDVEALAPAITELLEEALLRTTREDPEEAVEALKTKALGALLDVLAKALSRLNGQRDADLRTKLSLLHERLCVPLTKAQVDELMARDQREGRKLARQFIAQDL